MVEAFKSVVFVAVAVMVALVLQAQAASFSNDEGSEMGSSSIASPAAESLELH